MAALAEHNTSSEIVFEAQKLINKAAMASKCPENGAFDKATVSALKTFQAESGLAANGVLDSKTMDLLRKAAKEPQPDYQVTVGGKTYLFTKQEHAALIKRMKDDFKAPMFQLKSAMDEARFLWDAHKDLRSDQYIVSWCIEAYSRADFPSESVIKAGEKAVSETEKALNSGQMKAFSLVFPKAQKQVNTARTSIKTYCNKLVSGGDDIVTGLEFVSTASFITVGILAAPVAAGYGMGAVAAGVVAGAGTNAIETLSREVGKGIAGTSGGIGKAAKNVLLDSFICGSVGALVKGKPADKLIAKLGPMVAGKLSGQIFKKASANAVSKFVIGYFQKNGSNILEGIMKETISSFKSASTPLTVDKFLSIVAKEVATAGVFSKLESAGNVTGAKAFKLLSSKQRKDLIISLGKGAKEKDLIPIFSKVFEEQYKNVGSGVYDKVLSKLSGTESEEKIQQLLVDEVMTNKKVVAIVVAEAEKNAKKQGR